MADYSPERLRKNQIEVLGLTATLTFAALIAFALGAVGIGGLIAWFTLVAALGSLLWWLFASKKAGDIDGTWADGHVRRDALDTINPQRFNSQTEPKRIDPNG